MEVSDAYFVENRDWDPSYLSMLFSEDFNDFSELWNSNVSDMELVSQVDNVDKVEPYCPIVEDISLEDEVLCSAVERIEEE